MHRKATEDQLRIIGMLTRARKANPVNDRELTWAEARVVIDFLENATDEEWQDALKHCRCDKDSGEIG